LLAKPTPRNVNLGSDRFAMFNKERDIPRIVGVHKHDWDGPGRCPEGRNDGRTSTKNHVRLQAHEFDRVGL
jgi:hypothetical protein